MKVKIDNFVLAIIAVVVLSYIFPQWGRSESPVPLDKVASIGVSLIFFFYGLKLSREKLKSGLKNWKLHVLVQLSTFLIFPLIVLAFYPTIRSEQDQTVWLSFLFLAALPSTVSSSVVMVAMAKGNIPAAIFNASISGLLGIVITPLWMGFFMVQSSGDFQLTDVYFKLVTEILMPVFLGLLLQPFFGTFVVRFATQLSMFDKSVILVIIYKSFAFAFDQGVFASIALLDLVFISLACLALFFMVFVIIGFVSDRLKFTIEDKITAQFCGTKKSLVHGTVFSKILFPASFPIAMILLPLMIFHALQILIVSIIAARWAERA